MDHASPLAPYRATPAELQARLDAERGSNPFLVYRDGEDVQRIVELHEGLERVTIGRRASNDVPLEWDVQASRLHAELERLGQEWTVSDDGLSSNGTFVNGVRIRGRRRLRDGDSLTIGTTTIAFLAPTRSRSMSTVVPTELAALPRLSDSQRAVLVALARPYKHSGAFGTPATNKEIAASVVLSIDGVKSIMRVLFDRFGVADLPQNEKRARLVERAFQLGAISQDDL